MHYTINILKLAGGGPPQRGGRQPLGGGAGHAFALATPQKLEKRVSLTEYATELDQNIQNTL